MDTWDLDQVRETFRGDLMFDLEAKGATLQELVDFDQILQSIHEEIGNGEGCIIVLLDWIDEDEYLGTISLLKQDASTLVVKVVDVEDARKIRPHLISDLRSSLALFYTLVDAEVSWEEEEQ